MMMIKKVTMKYLGNKDILNGRKTGFLSSQKCTADVVLKSYDWAKQMRTGGKCVITGNHSQIEKDVYEILLKGKQPLILVLARGLQKRYDTSVKKAIDEGRLLVISPFEANINRVTREGALVRNKLIIELADEMMVGYITEGGQLEEILKNKKHLTL